jgi:hypothetical protein
MEGQTKTKGLKPRQLLGKKTGREEVIQGKNAVVEKGGVSS